MRRSDLKNGMWVVTNNGDVAMVLLNTANGDILSGKTWFPLENLNDNLKYGGDWSDTKIMKVYQPKSNRAYLDHFPNIVKAIQEDDLRLVWEREDYTEQIKKLQAEALDIESNLAKVRDELNVLVQKQEELN